MKPTKIDKLETILLDSAEPPDKWLLLKVYCEDGTVGIGEAGVHGWQRPTEAMLRACEPYLIGKDPGKVEHHFQFLYRNSHFMGSVINGALSAIDIALWDIKGKRLGVPIYELLGGKTRDKARCYIHVKGGTPDELANDAKRAVGEGFTAVRFHASGPEYWLHQSNSKWANEAVTRVGAVRETVGPDIDICVEIHGQMSPAESIALGRQLEPLHPYFYEDPMLPDNPALMADIKQLCNLPIATGERLTSIFEYQQLLENRGCAYVRPDVCLCGGLSGSKKVAAMAESHHIKVIPHNPLSPVSTAASLQLDACIPNFALQEFTGESEPPKSELLVEPSRLEDGYLVVPEGPGLGIELNESAIAKYTFTDKVLETPIAPDGSVADR